MTRQTDTRPTLRLLPLLGLGLAAVSTPSAASAAEFILNIEPAAAFWVDQPQTDRFGTGFYLGIRPGVSLGPVLALQASYNLLMAPPSEQRTASGAAHAWTVGVRLRPWGATRPQAEQLAGWTLDGNMGYVQTGGLDRFGFDAGLAYLFQLSDRVALGPVLRYSQIVQGDGALNQDPNDAQILSAGLNLSFGSVRRAGEPQAGARDLSECPPEKECPAVDAVLPVGWPCSDKDRDGLCDSDDRCPNQIGPLATLGCPVDPCSGAPLVVLVQFGYDSATLPNPSQDDPQTMDPVLDAVASAIEQDPTCRVCIMGYSSEEGGVDYNLELSQRRATAVQGYMTARGLSRTRMPTIGLGERCQIVPESSRLLNRRVEFHRLLEGEACPVACTE